MLVRILVSSSSAGHLSSRLGLGRLFSFEALARHADHLFLLGRVELAVAVRVEEVEQLLDLMRCNVWHSRMTETTG